MELPIPNTPRILERKKKRIQKIWTLTAILCAGLIAAFLISIHTDPPASFLFSVCCIAAPFLILFIAAMLHFHIKYFPEFDFGNLTPEQIEALPVSETYLSGRRKLRRRMAIQFLPIVIFTLIGILPAAIGRPDPKENTIFTRENIMYVTDFIAILGVLISAGFLKKTAALRRRLEYEKYRLE